MQNKILWLLVAGLLWSCGPSQELDKAGEKPENPLAEQLVLSTLWYQTAPEAELVIEQAYVLALHRLEQNLAREDDGRPPAVILDLDETVLDNSPYEARLVLNGESYTPESWSQWVEEARADALPGVLLFLEEVQTRGVTIFYISNRAEVQMKATLRNMRNLGLPMAEAGHVLLKTATSDKTARRNEVKREYRVVLSIGDQITDFAENYEELLREPAARDSLRQYFIALPNPMYGEFLKRAEQVDTDQQPGLQEKARLRKEALKTKN